jgi:hypothetical protein
MDTVRIKLTKGIFYQGRMWSADAVLDMHRSKGVYLCGTGAAVRCEDTEPLSVPPRLYHVPPRETQENLAANIAGALATAFAPKKLYDPEQDNNLKPDPEPEEVFGDEDAEPVKAKGKKAR